MKSELRKWRDLERETVEDLAYWLAQPVNPRTQSKVSACERQLVEIRDATASLSNSSAKV